MFDLSNEQKRGRLLKAVKTSREAMRPFRVVRERLIRDYVGSWYSDTKIEPTILVNLINQTAKIYTVALAANNPKVMVSTPVPEYLPFAYRFETNLNTLISDMQLDQTFRAIVLDAFFCVGCGVVMMRDTDTRFHGLLESEEDGWLDPGEPWLNRVSLDDLILDMSVRELSKMRFCGHLYRADYEKVMDEPAYSKAVKNKISPSKRSIVDAPGRAADIAHGGVAEDDELKPMLWLMDLWVPENKSIATFVFENHVNLPPLIERDWTGSQGGPYKFLSLGTVPDNLIPSSPAMNLKGLHDLQNRLHRRMRDDSDAHKKNPGYPPGGDKDAERVKSARRNQWVMLNDPKNIGQVEVGGIDQRDQAFSLFLQDEYDRFAGNLRAMGGLGAQAETVGQEEIIQGNVSRMEADMQLAVVNFAAECCYDLGYLMWNDENLSVSSSIELGNVQVDLPWETGNRQGSFEDYRFRVEPYSMVYKTPQQKLQELFGMFREIAPLWPMMQASGMTLDGQAIVEEISRLLDRPEFTKFITFANPAMELGGDQNTIRQSPVTTRNTVRRNVPTGGTADSRSALLQQVLSGASNPQVNSQQSASMMRAPA